MFDSNMKKLFFSFLMIFFIISFAFSVEIQTGKIAGRIIDKNTQKSMENVTVAIDGEEIGICNQKGEYIFKDIPIGSHQISYRRIGYKTRMKINVFIKPNQTTIINIEMKPQAITIEGISVKEEVFFRETPDAPVSSKTLDIEEIRSQPSGVYDIQRAIQALPAVVGATDQQNEIIVRGGNYGENLFILDNIELENPNHFAWPGTGGGPISMITPEFVDEVDFYAGAFPSRYGDKASSVLAITTRNGNKNNFEAKFDVGMSGYGGDIEGPLFSKGSYLLSYHRSFMSLLSESIGLTAVPYYQSILGKQVINFSPFTKLTINQLWGSDKITILHESSGYSQGAGETDIYSRSGQYMFGATLKSIYNRSYSLLTLSRNHQWWERDLYEADTKERYYHAYDDYNALKYSHTFPYTFVGKFEAGVAVKYDETDFDMYGCPDTLYVYDTTVEEIVIIDTLKDQFGNPRYLGNSEPTKNDTTAYKLGGYLQWENHFGKFTLNTGIRYDYFSYIKEGTIAPRIGMKYAFSDRSNLSLGLGRHYQNPDYYTLNHNELNKELDPKYTDQVVLGIDRLLAEDIKISIETYYKIYRDVPVRYSDTTPDSLDWVNYSINVGEGYAKGMEFFLQKKVKDNFWGTISYSYSIARAEDPRFPDEEIEYSWDFDYRHVFTGILGYKFEFMKYEWYERNRSWMKWLSWTNLIPSDETEISIKYRYLGGKPYTVPTYDPGLRRWIVSGNQEFNTERFQAYQRFDFHIQHRWFESSVNIISYLEVDNLFGTKNIWDYDYLDDGSKDTIYQWGRMIIGGVMIEF
ncbi:MAG: TonB-dependent receptor [Candidatus Cloacimonetes bacterium]|nr:TonB-dependent receptor [Candidatus Cloacimonadota bacterium]